MKKALYYYLSVIPILLIACFEDKGNYDYAVPVNPIVSIGFNDPIYQAILGDSIEIIPVLTYTDERDTNRFDFEWRVNGELYATTRNLVFKGREFGTSWGLLSVIDRETRVQADKTFTVNVSSRYSDGWIVLTEEDGRSVVGIVISKYESGGYVFTPYYDIYSGGEAGLGTDPFGLVTHAPQILVLQRGGKGSVELNGNTMSPYVYLNEEFVGGQPPMDLKPIDAYYTRQANVLLNHDGQLYLRYTRNHELHLDPYNNQPILLDAKKHSAVSRIIKARIAFGAEQVVMHDSVNNRILCFGTYPQNMGGGGVQTIPDKNYVYPENYTKLSDMGSMKLVWGAGTMPGQHGQGYVLVLKDPDTGKYYFQKFGLRHNQSTDVFTFGITSSDHRNEIPLNDAVFTDKSQFVYVPMNGYMFFTAGTNNDQLYFYNTTAPKEPAKLVNDFSGDEIVALRLPNLISVSRFALGFKGGDFVLVDLPYNYHTNVVYTELFRNNFGKIVDIQDKPPYLQ